ncbi:2,3-dimethylmalate dehydratase small subunit [bacterium HR23]|nr:2,3-dimethylmalate dehydratase small subunit [bacterium HR23]
MSMPSASPLNKIYRGRVWVFGDSIDTDGIAPFYLYRDPEEMYKHTLESFRPEFPKQVRSGDIVVAGKNFGCGSARPPTPIFRIGVSAIVVESLAPLMLRNSVGLAYPVFIAPGVTSIVQDHQTIEIDYPNGVVRNLDTGRQVALRKYPPIVERIYAAGGIIPYTRQRYLQEQARRSP